MDSLSWVPVAPVTVVPGATRFGTGLRTAPTAIPFVCPAGKVIVVGWLAGEPEDGWHVKVTNGGFSVKVADVTDAGAPEMACEIVTVVGVTAVTIVPPGMDGPETPIPAITPAVALKCSTTSGPSGPVTGELGVSVKDGPGVVTTVPSPGWPMNETTVPAPTYFGSASLKVTLPGETFETLSTVIPVSGIVVWSAL